jgi:hypothetical protein
MVSTHVRARSQVFLFIGFLSSGLPRKEAPAVPLPEYAWCAGERLKMSLEHPRLELDN